MVLALVWSSSSADVKLNGVSDLGVDGVITDPLRLMAVG